MIPPPVITRLDLIQRDTLRLLTSFRETCRILTMRSPIIWLGGDMNEAFKCTYSYAVALLREQILKSGGVPVDLHFKVDDPVKQEGRFVVTVLIPQLLRDKEIEAGRIKELIAEMDRSLEKVQNAKYFMESKLDKFVDHAKEIKKTTD